MKTTTKNKLNSALRYMDIFFRVLLTSLVFIYQFFGPIFHNLVRWLGIHFECRYPETCSQFALRQLKENSNVISATYHIVRRLISCSSWGKLAAILPHSNIETKIQTGKRLKN